MAASPFALKDPSLARRFFADKISFTSGPAELAKVMNDGSVRIVDVRAREDFAREHIPGSINLPEGEWSNAEAHGLARDKTNVLLCYSSVCHLAARAAIALADQGFSVMELDGGFDAWKKHDLPTERGGEQSHSEPVERARALLEETRAAQASVSAAAAVKADADTIAKADPKEPEAKEPEAKEPEAKEPEARAEADAKEGAKADAEEGAKAEPKAGANDEGDGKEKAPPRAAMH